jgi:uncharacterized OB-fold protein
MADSRPVPPLPRPLPDQDSAPFWAGCREGRLLLQVCPDCRAPRYPPRPMCPACGTIGADWVAASGRGKVYSWVVPHHPVHPALVDAVPYGVVLVELDEGPRMVSNLIDTEPDEIAVDQRVEVVFEKVDDELTLPKFRRVDAGGEA